jgi:hypothetical protein
VPLPLPKFRFLLNFEQASTILSGSVNMTVWNLMGKTQMTRIKPSAFIVFINAKVEEGIVCYPGSND